MVMSDRIEARAVVVAGLAQDAMRPRRALVDRPARRTITADRDPGHVLEQLLRRGDVLAKRLRRLSPDADVLHPVARDLVALVGDTPHDARKVLCDPPQREEGSTHSGIGKELQDAIDVARQAALELGPARSRHEMLERRDLEVIFDVASHRVGQRYAGRRRPLPDARVKRRFRTIPCGTPVRRGKRRACAHHLRDGTYTSVTLRVRSSNEPKPSLFVSCPSNSRSSTRPMPRL